MKLLKLNIQRFAEDGWVSIKLDMDTKNFDAEIKKTTNELNKLQKKEQELIYLNQKMQEAESQGKAIQVTAKELNLMEKLGITMNDIGSKKTFLKVQEDIEKTNNKLIGLNAKQDEINNQGFNKMQKSLENIGTSIGGITKKVAKWALAIFSIRSIYMGIRQVVSQLLQSDENLKYQIDYMKWSVGQAIKPIVEWLVNAVHQLLVWIGAIIKILFGINIFANATAKNFQKAQTSAKKLQKTLAGFDEMNILNEDGSTGIGGAISNALKGWDLAKEVDDLAEKLKPFENDIKAIGLLALGIFGATTIAKWFGNIGSFMESSKGLSGLGSTLGKLATIAGGIIITTIIGKKVWEETEQLKKDIKSIRDNGEKAQEKWIKNENDINKLIATGNVNRQAGINLLKQSEGYIERQLDLDKEMVETAKQTAINISKQINKEIEMYNAGKLNNDEQEKLKQNIKDQISYNEMVIEKLKLQKKDTSEIEEINKTLNTQLYAVGNQIQWNKDMTSQWAINTDRIQVGFDGTVTILEEAQEEAKGFNSFLTKAGDKIREVNRTKIDNKSATVTMKMEMDTSSAERSANTFLNKWGTKIKQATAGTAFNIFGAKGMLYTPPKLAVGGIINQPGRGVPIGTALGGERGMEGVIPLTDSQQMALLGEAIGKYINVNLTNITELDGRQIARKVEQINQNDRFVLNR